MPRIDDAERERRLGILRRCYPTMSTTEIHAATGITRSWLIRYAAELGLKHTPETTRRINAKCGVRPNFDYGALSRRIRALYKAERCRLLGGEPQQYKVRIILMSEKTRRAMHRLKGRGYWFYDINERTVYYDEQTNRTRFEGLYAERHRIRFVDASTPR